MMMTSFPAGMKSYFFLMSLKSTTIFFADMRQPIFGRLQWGHFFTHYNDSLLHEQTWTGKFQGVRKNYTKRFKQNLFLFNKKNIHTVLTGTLSIISLDSEAHSTKQCQVPREHWSTTNMHFGSLDTSMDTRKLFWRCTSFTVFDFP